MIEYYLDDFSRRSDSRAAFSKKPHSETNNAGVIDEEQPEPFSSEDRRQHDRSRLILDVHFNGAESTGVASTRDISPGGLYMSTRMEIPVGATLSLRIPLRKDYVVVKGEVVYANPGEGVGVKFRDLTDEAKRSLENGLPLG